MYLRQNNVLHGRSLQLQLLELQVPAFHVEKRERATEIQREREPGGQWPR